MKLPPALFRRLPATVLALALISPAVPAQTAATNAPAPAPSSALTAGSNSTPTWISQPLSLAEAVNIALRQNGSIRRGQSDLEAAYGVVVQTRAIALPTLRATGSFQATSLAETFPFPNSPPPQEQSWSAGLQLVQTIYDGGKMTAALRSAKLTKQQAILQYETTVADALLQVRLAYYDVLLAADQIAVNEASVKLLTRQLADQKSRFEAGTVPRFNVLQAEVELSNERPKLIQARNAFRIAKNNLVNLLGYNLPAVVLEDIPLHLTDQLDANPYPVELPAAVAQALANRTELAALRQAERIRNENLRSTKGGYQPTVQLVGGYGGRNSYYNNDLSRDVRGFTGGAQFSWNIFDGYLREGQIAQAKAQKEGAETDFANETRTVEIEVRTQYSNFIEATEILESQKKVREEAEEALRLAMARNKAGTGTQLDVLSAQTALTQARSTTVQALHDYDAARARLERAMGLKTWGATPLPSGK